MYRFLLLGILALTSTTAAAATRIELKIDELRPNRTVPWPVTTGVPFPNGALSDEQHCRLVDDHGEEQLLQTKVAATWDADRSSIRWLTIDFIARPGRTYALEFGPDVRRLALPTPLQLVGSSAPVVRTGPLGVSIMKRAATPLRTIIADLNDNGQLHEDETVSNGDLANRWYRSSDGDEFTSALDGDDRSIVVESAGPVRASIRVDGWYTGPSGERIVGYRTRYHFFAGLSVIKVVDEFRVVGSTRELQFADIALPLDLHLGGESRSIAARIDEGAVEASWNGDGNGASFVQETFRHYGNPECKSYIVRSTADGESRVREGQRAGPWMQVVGERAAVTGSLRWFSQQFPKEWEATGDRLTLHLWSPRVEPLDFGAKGLEQFFGPAGQKYLVDWKPGSGGRTPITDFFFYAGRQTMERDGADGLGINKHHEIWYHFGPADKAEEGREYGELADAQPLCLATGEWNVSTGVFGPLAARPNDSPYEAIVDRIFDLERKAQDDFGDYGWFLFGAGPHYSYQWDPETQRHYADPRRFEFHTYQRETQLWWSYLRSGERKFYDWCLPSENHWVDVAVSHAPTKYTTLWRGGAPGEATLILPPGDWSIDSPLHYVRHHDTGEAWLRSASQFWGTYHRTLETTTLAYYLTGDERYNDVVNFWKDYWSPLAGVRSDMPDGGLPTHREQMWWVPTKPGEPFKSWAEMIRDYAPFQSGSRHQQTLFFNLATLYEHTWDPSVKQVLDEYAAAFLDPAAKNGVWQCQDHRLPANADSPMLAHYWAPALWKYARATNDLRMPEILQKYFTACIEADPYGGDVGIYSNNQIAWGWWFTKNPQFLVAAQHELDDLMPNAAPLEKPEDLNRRIYNPYAPIKSLAAAPRLIGIMEEAKRAGIAVPPAPPLSPQRAPIAFERPTRPPYTTVFWGWDPTVQLLDAEGRPLEANIKTTEHRSHRQPFDRVLPGYRVYRHEITTPRYVPGRWCFVLPQTELGILENARPWCCAAEPISIDARSRWYWRRPARTEELTLETSTPTQLRLLCGESPLPVKIVKNLLTVSLSDVPEQADIAIENVGERRTWFRVADVDANLAWMTPELDESGPTTFPFLSAAVTVGRRSTATDESQAFASGKFGRGLVVAPGRELHIPDEITTADGTTRRLSDEKQGTLEFWIRRLWDDRVAAGPRILEALTNGPVFAACPTPNLKFDDWTHVAIVWRPMPDGSEGSLVHAYFDGADYAFYRSLYWEGYSSKPTVIKGAQAWLKEFVAKAPPGAAFVLDDVRLSNVPRYVNLRIDFGRQQTFNPDAFTPPSAPAEFDRATVLLLPLDDDLRGTTVGRKPLEARIVEKTR